ncbi:hypothetical protein PN836_002005 [Ningiella sp. W23]|uniref:hypothetical protein n=1 Tax=Ningiella sp. W23 TaxID=3023715 RepID=UPI003756A863
MLASAVPGHLLHALNTQTQDNALAICTGSSTKWINSAVYFETGKLVELDLSTNSDSSSTGDILKQACSSFIAFDSKPSFRFDASSLFKLNLLADEVFIAGASNIGSIRLFLIPPTRAPPF